MDERPVDDAVMGLLAEHVPLSLLCDLCAPEAPDSAAILAAEGTYERAWWEPAGPPEHLPAAPVSAAG